MDIILQAGVVSAPLQVIVEKISSLMARELHLLLTPDEEVGKLQRTLERIKAMVAHVEQNRCVLSDNINNEAWKLWLQDVQGHLWSADDLLDQIFLDVAKYQATASTSVEDNASIPDEPVKAMLFSSYQLTVSHEISKIRKNLEEFAKEMEPIFLSELKIQGTYKNLKIGHYRATSSLVEKKLVIGRLREKNEILDMVLVREDTCGINLSVIPIVGMAGIGKSTLAQLVYGDDRLAGVFYLKMWVSVSMDFDPVRIMKSLVEGATRKRCELSDLDHVQIELQDLLREKRFLIVLDDYWSEEQDDWDTLSSPFRVGSPGSKIIVTTRSVRVSQILGTVGSYCLNCLSDEDCWELMKKISLSTTTLQCTELENIGRKIAEKCQGVPLVAKTLGDMLRTKYDPIEWKSVLESNIWDLPHVRNSILPALTRSYDSLPPHLKICFSYCSMFPGNSSFKMNELVMRWIAQGYINADGTKLLEEIGNDYFNDLMWRSFIQFSCEDEGQKYYKVNDMIRFMARLVSSERSYRQLHVNSAEEYPLSKNIQHFSLHCDNVDEMVLTGYDWYKSLRSFRVTCDNAGKVLVSELLFSKFKSLRELDLSNMGLEEVPETVGELEHLRLFNLSNNKIVALPDTITRLFGLQILSLEGCSTLSSLPRDMEKMVSLRHFYLSESALEMMPANLGKLINLQSLSIFIVGASEGCGINELKNMRLLRGSINIKNLENVSNMDEAKEAMLGMKPFINKLELEWSDVRSKLNDEEVLAGLHPHDDLEELLMKSYMGTLLPGWLSNPSCKLSKIDLQSCGSWEIIAPLGKLQCLEYLRVGKMSSCISIDVGADTFLSLVSLSIVNMPNLASWVGLNRGSFPCLSILVIENCPMLTNLPSLVHTRCLQDLEISECPRITSLPVDGLPESLQYLRINSASDELKERCTADIGADWSKIRSVPSVNIE